MPNPAVILFFVLSGYVLGESLVRNGGYVPFYIRRLFRIIPPFVVSVLFAYVCLSFVRLDVPPDRTSGFFQGLFWPAPTLSKLWDNLVLNSTWINGPTWSIYPEIIGSLLLPILLFGHRLAGQPYRWIVFIVTLGLILLTSERIVIYFYVGFFLSVEISRFVGQRSWLAAIFALAGFLILCFYSHQPFDYAPVYSIPNSIGAAMLVGADRFVARVLLVAGNSSASLSRTSFLQLLSAALAAFYVTAIIVALHPEVFSTGFVANIETASDLDRLVSCISGCILSICRNSHALHWASVSLPSQA